MKITATALFTLAVANASAAALKGDTSDRKPFYKGVSMRQVGRTAFMGSFDAFAKEGLVDLASDRDPKASRRGANEEKESVERTLKDMRFSSVDPSGAVFESTDLPVDVVRRVIEVGQSGQPSMEFPPMSGAGGTKGEKDAGYGKEAHDGAVDDEGLGGGKGKGRGRNSTAAAILGSDTRYEVSPASWRPTSQTGHLTFSAGGCSGALVGPRHVLTAGHCVHSGGSSGDWYGSFRFTPGRSSSDSSPVGTYGWSSVSTFTGWTNNKDSDYDLAVITLSSDVTGGTGWVSFGWTSSMSSSWYVYHKGYSGDKAYGTQWSTGGGVSDVWTHRFYTDTTDTVGGNSGGPVYKYNGAGNAVIYGPHSGWNAYWYWWGAKRNRHTRITSSKFTSMCDWINDASVC